ncbi:hypothetical protein CGC20_9695 [Leishmania donovani]|uniref:Uncharacterized protein n=1 Tax=Leishmania donovani TaxID=5661 RepID=A0A504Y1A5_LEIDO|nr:hypothetical protein CGC20_3025 [Leishmania donovani]TPP54481.1 hypothetical protein CGC20_9695 [Leishmania donovani]
MPSDTESSDFTDGDRPLSAAASVWNMTESSGAAASDRYATAPLLLQIRYSRAAQPTELLVADAPPSPSRPYIHPQLLAQRLPLETQDSNNADVQSGTPTTVGAAPQHEQKSEMRIAGPPAPSAMAREVSAWSEACAADSFAFLRNAREPSLSYTWTDSYLDESPSTTKARWMQQRTFGPVVQSEGGGSSTVSSTPRAPCETEAVWGGVQARSAAARAGAAEAVDRPQDGPGDERSRTTRGGGGARRRRFDLAAAETGENGLGRERPHDGVFDHVSTSHVGRRAKPTTAKPLFHVNRSDTSICTSNASTRIATVQQPHRMGQIAPIAKLLNAAAAVNTAEVVRLGSDDVKAGVSPSPTTNANLREVGLSSAFLDIVAASRPLSPARAANVADSHNAPRSRSSSDNRNQCESDGMGSSPTEMEQSRGNLRASRCCPPRGRVLKVIYED